MSKLRHVQEVLLEVVTTWRSQFDALPNPEDSIPTDIHEFTNRCARLETQVALHCPLSDVLDETTDGPGLHSLAVCVGDYYTDAYVFVLATALLLL